MPITTWIRDLLGIPKDVIDLKKSKLELENLEDEKRTRTLITPASLNDVKKYDPKYEELRRRIEQRKMEEPEDRMLGKEAYGLMASVGCLLFVLAILVLLFYYFVLRR